MENIRILSSERSGNLIVFNSHKYCFIRLRKVYNIEKWTCTNNKCTASLLIENIGENKSIKEILVEHCHSTIATSKIERQVLRENYKRKVADSVSTKPVKIIRTKLMKCIDTTVLQHKDFNLFKKRFIARKEKYILFYPRPFLRLLMN